MSKYKIIDMNTYPRIDHFHYFKNMQNPYVGITVDVDVTELVKFCKDRKISFYLTFMHAATNAANRIPEMRQRIVDDGIVEYESCGSSHTESVEDGTYVYCTLFHDKPLDDYIVYASNQREACKEKRGLEEDEDVNSLYFISTLPWIKYSALIQPTACGDESNPRITWGKYELDYKNREMMPVSLLCHHALVDGIHLAKFYEYVEEEMKKIIDFNE